MRKQIIFIKTSAILSLLLLLFCLSQAQAQNQRHELISSQGTSHTVNTMVFDWSLGEPFVETLSLSDGKVLTQGFHQPWLDIRSNISQRPETLNISLYPNPVQHELRLQADAFAKGNYQCSLYTMEGKELLKQSIKASQHTIDLSDYAAANYQLHIYDNTSNTPYTYTLIKTH